MNANEKEKEKGTNKETNKKKIIRETRTAQTSFVASRQNPAERVFRLAQRTI